MFQKNKNKYTFYKQPRAVDYVATVRTQIF